MTAYNRQQFIAEAIESVLGSSYQHWELIIVDDGSSDHTVQIAREYASRDQRIKVYINAENLGDYPNRNQAASYANGAFLMYCDSDDGIFPHSIQYLVELAQRFPEMHLFMRSQNTEIEQLDAKTALNRHFFEKQFLFYGPGAMFIRKDFFFKIGQFPVKYGPANDMYFSLKAVADSGVVIHPNRVNFYRLHEKQERNNEKRYLIENFRYMQDALNEIPLPLNKFQIKWLKKKNNRRFMVNLWMYSKKKKQAKVTLDIWKQAGFNFSKLISGILN